MTDRPNFLFLITDQQRADWLGCYGHPVVKTPNIDRIAERATRFDNFHVASPVCSPNRASLLTGRYPSLHGLRYNGCHLPANAVTFVDVLAAAGYDTAAIGKSHLQPFVGEPPKRADTPMERHFEEAWRPDGVEYTLEQPQMYQSEDRAEFPPSYYGYKHVDMVTRHGDRAGGHYEQWFRANAEDWTALRDNSNELPHNYSCPQAFRTPIPEALYPTRYIADRAIEYIGEREGAEEPFFAFVSFPDPHHPFNPPGKYWDMYSPEEFEVTLHYEDHQNPTPPMQFMDGVWRRGEAPFNPQTALRLGDQELKEAMALTAGMTTMIDDEVGRIMSALEATGLSDNTVVCYNSDHGDYLGDFNMLLKGAMPFRSITRVPFLWADPKSDGPATTETLCSTIDLSATILDRAGLNPYRGIQGESFLSTALAGETHREELFIEHNDVAARLGFSAPPRTRTLLTREWRLTVYGGEDWGELYDLTIDPQETHNLWDVPEAAAVKSDMLFRLTQHMAAQMDESPRATRAA